MSESTKIAALIEEMRAKGDLPALDSNVGAICSLTEDPNSTSTSDLTGVILRDCALTSSVISTANSALYSPSEPIKTISTAILALGFEKVKSLAVGLGILQQVSQCAKSRNLYRLFACSYFSGMFAMALGKRIDHGNPEELLVGGVLAELPRLLLAYAFPERYETMDHRIMNDKQSLSTACMEVFGVDYDGLVAEIARYWNIPQSIAKCLKTEGQNDRIGSILRNATRIADMMFGNQTGGTDALSAVEKELGQSVFSMDFKLTDFVDQACANDQNVQRFFKLSPKDIEMMVRIVEWGKVSSAQVAETLTYGAATRELAKKPEEDPAIVIGGYLTGLILDIRRGGDLNHIILSALEALYRCVRPNVAIMAFLDSSKKNLEGRIGLGTTAGVKAGNFRVSLVDAACPPARCLQQKKLIRFSARAEWPIPFLKDLNADFTLLAPIVVFGNAIGLFLLTRNHSTPFGEQEDGWTEAVAGHVALAFERGRV